MYEPKKTYSGLTLFKANDNRRWQLSLREEGEESWNVSFIEGSLEHVLTKILYLPLLSPLKRRRLSDA